MTASTSTGRLKGIIKKTLRTYGPMKASKVLDKVVELLGVQRAYKAGMSLDIREAIWSLLSNNEILLSPDRKLYLPKQKIDQ